MHSGVEGQCGRAFLSLPRLLGVPGWRLHWEQTEKEDAVRATGVTDISLREVSTVVTLLSLYSLT